jgi:hypothetical protein
MFSPFWESGFLAPNVLEKIGINRENNKIVICGLSCEAIYDLFLISTL